jgi:tetratricopeptide (TPR) repeat protein
VTGFLELNGPHKFDRRWAFAAALAIAALTVLVYWPAVHNGFVNWDDPFYLGRVAKLKRVSLASIAWMFTALPVYYQPLTWLSHLIDFQIWGWNLAGHHATSVLLHGANAALVCLFIWILTATIQDLRSSTRLLFASGVALVFGIHPLQVESVAWIAERKTILCSLFSLMCLCAYVRAVSENRHRGWWWTMTVLFLAALASKPMAVSLPLVMLAMDFYPLRRHRQRSWRQLIGEKLVLFACSVVFGVLTVVAQSQMGAVAGFAGFGILGRCLVASRNAVFYVWKLIWPAWLSPYYPLEGKIALGEMEFLASLIGVILITALAFWRRNRWPVAWSTWCAYLALIAPVSGLLQVGPQGAGDRFMYLAMIPLLVLAGAAVLWLCRRSSLVGRTSLAGALSCLVIFYGVRTWDQIPVWRDDLTLWMTAAYYFPNSAVTNWKIAIALTNDHRYEVAETYAQKAVRLNPNYGSAHAALGEIYLKTGRYPEAITEAEEASRLSPQLPNAGYVLAQAYARLGRYEQSLDMLRKVFVLDPTFVDAAVHDEELAALRNQPEYAARFAALVKAANN